MPRRITIPNRIIISVSIPIPTLRIGRVGNDRVRLDKAVDIRRTPELHRYKNKIRRGNDMLRHAVDFTTTILSMR